MVMTNPDIKALCERLRELTVKEVSDGTYCREQFVPINPDGPEAATALEVLSARVGDAERDETCPLCEGKRMAPGEFCIANCRDGVVRWNAANVLRNVKPWMEGDHRRAQAAEAEVARLRGSLTNLITKLDDAMPHIEGAIVMADVHGCPYKGPYLSEAIEAARAFVEKGE